MAIILMLRLHMSIYNQILESDRGYGPSQIFEENGLKYQVCLIEIIHLSYDDTLL